MKLPLLLLFLFFPYMASIAQEVDTVNGIHRIDLGMSVGSYSSVDQLGSPLRYHSTTAPVLLEYQYDHPNIHQELYLSLCVSGANASALRPSLSDDQFDRVALLVDGECYYSYLRTVVSDSISSIRIQLGASLDNIGSFRRYKYRGSDFYTPGGIATWEAASMLGATMNIEYKLSISLRSKASFSLPLLSAIVRPPFDFFHTESSVIEGSDGHIVAIGGMGGYRFSAGLEYDIGSHITLGAQFISRFFRYERYGWTSAWLHQGGMLTLGWRI